MFNFLSCHLKNVRKMLKSKPICKKLCNLKGLLPTFEKMINLSRHVKLFLFLSIART